MSMGSAAAALSDAVDGVRLNGEDSGMRRPVEPDDVPGRARPACSFCSAHIVSKVDRISTINRSHTICPPQQRRDELQRLKLLRITPVYTEEMQKVIRDNLPIDVVLRPSLFEYPQCFGEVLVECYGFVAQFADEQVLLLDFFLEG